MKVKPHILVVDDEPNVRKVLRTLLEQAGCLATMAASGREALDLVRGLDPDLVLTDLKMPEIDGMELLDRLKVEFPEIPVVLLTAHATVDRAVQAMRHGAQDFLAKPFDKEVLQRVVEKALAQASRRRMEFQGPLQVDAELGIVGGSPAIIQLRRLVQRVAPTPSTVLITGETGTGKELVADALHQLSPRQGKALVKINCGALAENLVDAELFGHEKGAFTGADRARPGRFELAHEGTLFLDEIGELPAAVQVKLLRVLQDGVIDRVGSTESRQVDVRLISATHCDLAEMVAAGRYRQDLLYRLQVIEIRVPPLRERLDDIPLLVDFFLSKHSTRLQRPRPSMKTGAVEELLTLPWPGNVRELENVVERAVLLCEGGEIASFLQPIAHGGQAQASSMVADPAAGNEAPGEEITDLKAAARAASLATERRLILATLHTTGGNVTHAARHLCLSRRGLQMKMKELGIRATS